MISTAAAARTALADAATVLIDVDGCLTAGGRALPGAADFLAACGSRAIIVSNNSTDTPQTMAGAFARLGLAVDPSRIMLAGAVMIETLRTEWPQETVCLVSAEGLRTHAADRGIRLVEERAGILALARDTGFTYDRLRHAARQLHAGARLVAANPDLTHPDSDGGPVPETGALLAAVRACAPHVEPTIIGKPEPRLFKAALAAARAAPHNAVMVGDNPDTDGAGARRLGMGAILVGPKGSFAGVGALAELMR